MSIKETPSKELAAGAALHVYLHGDPASGNEERVLLFIWSHALLDGTSPRAVEKLKIISIFRPISHSSSILIM